MRLRSLDYSFINQPLVERGQPAIVHAKTERRVLVSGIPHPKRPNDGSGARVRPSSAELDRIRKLLIADRLLAIKLGTIAASDLRISARRS